MRFLIREISGWLLLALGLFAFYICLMLLLSQHIWEAGILTGVGFVIFRGGIHLLKVAVAAQVCVKIQDRLTPERPLAVPAHPIGRRPTRPAFPPPDSPLTKTKTS